MSSRTILFVVGGCGAAALVAAALFFSLQNTPDANLIQSTQTILIDGTSLEVAIADTDSERGQGLSDVTELEENTGLLFEFQEDGQHSFWMKDMLFSIDMLWITANGAVVHVEHSVSPDTFPQSFTSPTPARYVLEVPAGFAEQHGIGVGSKVPF
ncbi:MAG: DUF192 domain-containing protein [Minisyncoccia bacterium]